jgi:hypothetical protein
VSQVEGDDAAEGDGVGRDARDGTKNPEARDEAATTEDLDDAMRNVARDEIEDVDEIYCNPEV